MPLIDPTTPTGVQPNGFTGGYSLILSDEFNSSTLDTKWHNEHDFADHSASTSWDINAGGNSALRMWWNGNTGTDNQQFSSTGSNPWRGRYGFFEARVRAPQGKGFFPGWWLYPYSNSQTENGDGNQHEIDITEWFSYENGDWLVDTSSYQSKNCKFTIWTDGGGGATTQAGGIYLRSGTEGNASRANVHGYDNTLSTQYHTYGLQWTVSGGLKFYFDGVLQGTVPDPWGTNNVQCAIIVQLWWGGNGGNPVPAGGATPSFGSPPASNAAGPMYWDYVRAWSIGGSPSPAPAPAPTNWSIMPLGDSVTEGQDDASLNYRIRLASLLQSNNITSSFIGSMTTYTVNCPTGYKKHEGHSGWCTYDGPSPGICQAGNVGWDPSRPIGIDDHISTWYNNNKALIVLLAIGINDADASTVQTHVGSIINKIQAISSSVKILVSTIRTNGNAQTSKNNAITAACNGKTGVTVVNAYAGWNDGTMFQGDGLHPNATGYVKMGDNWFGFVQTAISGGTPSPSPSPSPAPVPAPSIDPDATLTEQKLSDDMTLAHEAHAQGVNPSWLWGAGPVSGPPDVGVDFPPAYPDPYFAPWGVVASDSDHGSTATNVRVQIRYMRLDVKRNGVWTRVGDSTGPQIVGAVYTDYENNINVPADIRQDTAGMSVKLPAGGSGQSGSFHFYPNVRFKVDFGAQEILVRLEARLIVDDTSLPDDRVNAKLLAMSAGDVWKTQTQTWNGTDSNVGFASGRFTYVTNSWKLFTSHTFANSTERLDYLNNGPQPAPAPAPAPAPSPGTAPMTALLDSAPGDGATLAGVVTFQIHGDSIANAELLPGNAGVYLPMYGRFTLAPGDSGPPTTVGTLNWDTTTLPAGSISVRISAFSQPPGGGGAEIVVMTRTYLINNTTPTPAPTPSPGTTPPPAPPPISGDPTVEFCTDDLYTWPRFRGRRRIR